MHEPDAAQLEDRANADNTQSHTNGQERGIQLGGNKGEALLSRV